LGETTVNENKGPKIANIKDDGFGAQTPEATKEGHSDKKTEDAEHEETVEKRVSELNIRSLSDAFADKQINCSCVFPYDDDPGKEQKIERIISAALPSDIVIIDWYLQEKDASITTEILKRIAENDAQTNGRIRLICIYTQEPSTEALLSDAKQALEEGGLPIAKFKHDNEFIQGDNFYLTVVTKKDISEEELPKHLLTCAKELSKGMLPSFALAAVSAIRKNMHHIITKFSDDLDAAYVANRLIADTPEDVSELIKDLFISECNTALEIEKVAEKHLDIPQIEKWVNFHNQPVNETCEPQIEGIAKYEVTKAGLENIIKEGRPKVKDKKLQNVSHCLHKTTNASIEAQKNFSNFVVMKHELAGNNKINLDSKWEPVLSTGSILYKQSGDKTEYYYCLTPACDTLRIEEETNFLFLRLEDPSSVSEKKANLVITDQEGKLKMLYINPKPSNIAPFPFKGNTESKKVKAKRINPENGTPHFTFETTSGEKLYWLGEVRDHRATHDMAELNRQWLRLGINDSEYLRLAGRGKALFK
jgi:hypothetical protein